MIGKFNQGEPIKITEGDIDTWHNLPVLVPVGLIPEGRTPCEVRGFSLDGDLRVILADKPAVDPPPTWVPPVSLPDGPYRWEQERTRLQSNVDGVCVWADYNPSGSYKDWTDPKSGRWQVTNGTATWLGE